MTKLPGSVASEKCTASSAIARDLLPEEYTNSTPVEFHLAPFNAAPFPEREPAYFSLVSLNTSMSGQDSVIDPRELPDDHFFAIGVPEQFDRLHPSKGKVGCVQP